MKLELCTLQEIGGVCVIYCRAKGSTFILMNSLHVWWLKVEGSLFHCHLPEK